MILGVFDECLVRANQDLGGDVQVFMQGTNHS
jgi:hypothetical protein